MNEGAGGGERIHKYIANCGYCSRRRAEELIARGAVRLNGEVVTIPGRKVVPGSDRVTVDGNEIRPPSALTVLLNKPAGYITTKHDTHRRPTVMDLLPAHVLACGVLPAGRLDLDTEGLLVLTNDGELLHRITHPRFGCEKEYRVHISRVPGTGERARLERGIVLPAERRRTRPARIEGVQTLADGTAILNLRIREGMKRQVRRMFEQMGMQVLELERVAIGRLDLGGLERGHWRPLAAREIALLFERTTDPARRPRPPRGSGGRKRAPARAARSARGPRRGKGAE